LLSKRKQKRSLWSADAQSLVIETNPGVLETAPPKSIGTEAPNWPIVFSVIGFFFFQKKKQKALVLLRRRSFDTQPSAKPTQGVWGRAPSKTLRQAVFFFSRKEAKALVLLRRRL
jgi:hypothetical protein